MSEVAQAPHSSPDGHIPQLRFPEFNVSWNEYKLGSITDVVDSLHTTPKDYVSSGFPMIRVVDVSNIELDLNKCLNVSEETYRQFTKKYQPKVGDVVLSRVGTCGASIMLRTKDNVCLGQNTVLLHPKINKDFYHILVKSNIFQVQVSRRVVGSTQKTLSLKDLKLFKLNIPAKPEQQKIAEFLTAVDNKIEQLSKKQALLGEYKKGLMQQIFSQAIRFKADDGSDFPDWKENKVDEFMEVTRGQVLAVPEMRQVESEIFKYPVYSSQTKNNGLTGYYTDYLFEDCITWTTDGANAGDVNYRAGKFYCTNVCGVLRSKKGYANLCIAQILNSVSRRYVSYVGNPKLMNNVMEKIKISIPSSINEQTKIANFLSSVDSKIEEVGKQLDESKQFKKALLQKMFV